MGFVSPDSYRRQAGFRRSQASAVTPMPVMAYNAMDLHDPRLVEFMRDGRISTAGVAIGERQALRNPTFFRAVSLICGSMGMLPIHLMRRLADGRIEKAKDHPLSRVLLRKPNGYQTATQFKSYMQLCVLLDGAAYALKVKSRGAVRQLIPLPRRAVKPKLSPTFELTFEYRRPSGGTVILQQDDVFWLRAPVSIDGLNGVSLLDIATDTLGLAVRAQQAAGNLLSKGVMAGGALETDASLGTEAMNNLRESLRANHSGVDAAGDWLLLEEGLKAKPFAGSAKDAELALIRKYEAEEMARFSGVPRPLLMFDETSWGSGIEQLSLFFVTYCLMMWFVIWEEAIWFCLLSEAEQDTLYAKVNEGALLRGSLKDQAEFFAKALGSGGSYGWMKQNEVRSNFDLNPEADGEDLPRPGTTAAAIAKEDA